MSLWSRLANVLRGDRVSREIDEEILSHLEEAIEHGRDPAEARSPSRRRPIARLLDPPLRARSRSCRAHLPHGRHPVRNRRRGRAGLHRHGNRPGDRRLRPNGHEEPSHPGVRRESTRHVRSGGACFSLPTVQYSL
jgi:hypothetical protein